MRHMFKRELNEQNEERITTLCGATNWLSLQDLTAMPALVECRECRKLVDKENSKFNKK